MSKNIFILTKWFPTEILEEQDFFEGCKEMKITGLSLITQITHLFDSIKINKGFKFNHHVITENEMLITVST